MAARCQLHLRIEVNYPADFVQAILRDFQAERTVRGLEKRVVAVGEGDLARTKWLLQTRKAEILIDRR